MGLSCFWSKCINDKRQDKGIDHYNSYKNKISRKRVIDKYIFWDRYEDEFKIWYCQDKSICLNKKIPLENICNF